MKDRRPLPGEGERRSECPHYSECLDLAAKEKWRSWKCDSCSAFQADKKGPARDKEESLSEPPEKRICEDCGARPTIKPNVPYCPRCMAIRGNKKRWQAGQRKESKARPRKVSSARKKALEEAPGAAEGGKPEDSLVINFGSHGDLLRAIERLSEEEIRPIEMQVIYLLREALRENRAIVICEAIS